jgi:hypothetical protein
MCAGTTEPTPGSAAAQPAPSSQSLVKPADCHDQHKPTQPSPGRPIPWTVPYEQNPQVRGHITGSRAKTRTWNLPVNSRLLCQLSYAGSTRIRVAHLGRACDDAHTPTRCSPEPNLMSTLA